MRAISAADSVSPAIDRTKEFLFRPFAWGTYLKLCLVALVTEGLGSNLRSSHNENHPSPGHGLTVHYLSPQWIAVIVAAVLVAMILGIVIFYLVTRLRFAFFHCLVHNTREIRPGWWIYRKQAMRFFGLNIVVGLCYLLLVGLVSLPFIAGIWRLVHEMPPGGHPSFVLLLSVILPLIPIVILLVLFGILLDVILRDLVLPHYALDDASAGEAWNWVWAHIMAEKRQFFVYALLRLVLPLIAMVGLFVVLIIPGLMLAGAVAGIEYGIHSVFADAAGASAMIGIALQVFFGIFAFCFAVFVSICLGGPLSTWLREYALVFYGGRYQALGDALYPPPPAIASGGSEIA